MTNVTTVTTGMVRLSYVNLLQPYAHQPGADPKYSVTVLVPKTDVQTKALIDAAVNAAKQNGVSKTWGGVMPPLVAVCVHDGDGTRPSDGMPFGDECKGNWVFTASSKQQPGIVDANIQPLLDATKIYSGVYGRVSVNFFPYFNSGKKALAVGLTMCKFCKMANRSAIKFQLKKSLAQRYPVHLPRQLMR